MNVKKFLKTKVETYITTRLRAATIWGVFMTGYALGGVLTYIITTQPEINRSNRLRQSNEQLIDTTGNLVDMLKREQKQFTGELESGINLLIRLGKESPKKASAYQEFAKHLEASIFFIENYKKTVDERVDEYLKKK